MQFFIGDKYELKATAYDPKEPSKPLYTQGTVVTIAQIQDSDVVLLFPDKQMFLTSKDEVLKTYNRIEPEGKVLVATTDGLGTPPAGLHPYLPKEADWKRNYRYRVIVELQDRGLKANMCSKCYEDLGETFELDERGLTNCENCGIYVVAIKPNDFKYHES